MKILIVFLMCLHYILTASIFLPLTTMIRTPQDDTAVVESTRINGNFAYSSAEGHAYKAITPLVGQIIAPGPLLPVQCLSNQFKVAALKIINGEDYVVLFIKGLTIEKKSVNKEKSKKFR